VKTYVTPQEYLALERKAEYKSEYYRGEFAVDEADAALAGGGVGVAGVVGDQAEIIRGDLDLAQIQGPDGVVFDRDFVGFPVAVVGDGECRA